MKKQSGTVQLDRVLRLKYLQEYSYSEGLMSLLFQFTAITYLYILTIIEASVFLPGISWSRNQVQKNTLLSGDVWSGGRLPPCIKSEAFKVHQILCLSVNELCRSSAVKLVLLRVVGATGGLVQPICSCLAKESQSSEELSTQVGRSTDMIPVAWQMLRNPEQVQNSLLFFLDNTSDLSFPGGLPCCTIQSVLPGWCFWGPVKLWLTL